MQILLADETLVLDPAPALIWPARATAFIADAHFGKAAAFRAQGVPVPAGTTSANLSRLDALILRHQLKRMVFLGDLFHARSSHARDTLDLLSRWRAKHPKLVLTLVEGNHDLKAGAPPPELDFEVWTEPHAEGPFAFAHHPQTVAGRYVLAGHIHPAHALTTRRERVRLPCFWFGEACGVLPAFGSFTGTHVVTPAPADRVFLVAGEEIFAAPKAPSRV